MFCFFLNNICQTHLVIEEGNPATLEEEEGADEDAMPPDESQWLFP